jgi:hypothetical protein
MDDLGSANHMRTSLTHPLRIAEVTALLDPSVPLLPGILLCGKTGAASNSRRGLEELWQIVWGYLC